MKQNIITITCTAFTFLETVSFSHCDVSLIQKITVNSKTWDYTQKNFSLEALEFGSGFCSWLSTHNTVLQSHS